MSNQSVKRISPCKIPHTASIQRFLGAQLSAPVDLDFFSADSGEYSTRLNKAMGFSGVVGEILWTLKVLFTMHMPCHAIKARDAAIQQTIKNIAEFTQHLKTPLLPLDSTHLQKQANKLFGAGCVVTIKKSYNITSKWLNIVTLNFYGFELTFQIPDSKTKVDLATSQAPEALKIESVGTLVQPAPGLELQSELQDKPCTPHFEKSIAEIQDVVNDPSQQLELFGKALTAEIKIPNHLYAQALNHPNEPVGSGRFQMCYAPSSDSKVPFTLFIWADESDEEAEVGAQKTILRHNLQFDIQADGSWSVKKKVIALPNSNVFREDSAETPEARALLIRQNFSPRLWSQVTKVSAANPAEKTLVYMGDDLGLRSSKFIGAYNTDGNYEFGFSEDELFELSLLIISHLFHVQQEGGFYFDLSSKNILVVADKKTGKKSFAIIDDEEAVFTACYLTKTEGIEYANDDEKDYLSDKETLCKYFTSCLITLMLELSGVHRDSSDEESWFIKEAHGRASRVLDRLYSHFEERMCSNDSLYKSDITAHVFANLNTKLSQFKDIAIDGDSGSDDDGICGFTEYYPLHLREQIASGCVPTADIKLAF